jgi:hypothetical protein
MQGQSAVTERSVTPSDVLAYLNADYRLRAGLDPEVSDGGVLTATTTIEEWRSVCDLVSVRRLASAIPAWFDISASPAECFDVLAPERDRTLGDLSSFVAKHATWPDFRPLQIAGQSHAGAGAFFSLRGYLVRAGISVNGLRPSTPIESLSRKQFRYVLEAASRMAPDVVPVPTIIHSRRQRIGSWIVIVALLTAIVAYFSNADAGAYIMAATGVAGGLLLNRGRPASVTLEPYVTVGDLAAATAAAKSRANAP